MASHRDHRCSDCQTAEQIRGLDYGPSHRGHLRRVVRVRHLRGQLQPRRKLPDDYHPRLAVSLRRPPSTGRRQHQTPPTLARSSRVAWTGDDHLHRVSARWGTTLPRPSRPLPTTGAYPRADLRRPPGGATTIHSIPLPDSYPTNPLLGSATTPTASTSGTGRC
jgi:hypothetical protein